ncbi:MAG TPA: hypothetical protein VM890_04975 [Longimicrobium sp.]|nr:hypothetical protein [Longimicrobium sp.]
MNAPEPEANPRADEPTLQANRERDVAIPAVEIPIHRRLLPVLLPLLVNYPFTTYRGRLWELVEAIRPFDQYTYRPYVVLVTWIGSMLLPLVSIDGYARWVIGERRRIGEWSAWRLAALVLAAVAVVAQCQLSAEWTVESSLTRWWSLTLLFAAIGSPVVALLVSIVTLAIAARWALVRGRGAFQARRRRVAVMKAVAMFLALGALQACRPVAPVPPTAESRVLAEIANVAGLRGYSHVGLPDGGPLMIDVASFARYGRPVLGADVSKRQVEASLVSPYRDATERFAVRCQRLPHRCRIWRDGVYVRLDSVARRRGGGFYAFVTCFGTDYRHRNRPLLSMAGLRLAVRPSGAGWVVSPPVLVDIT